VIGTPKEIDVVLTGRSGEVKSFPEVLPKIVFAPIEAYINRAKKEIGKGGKERMVLERVGDGGRTVHVKGKLRIPAGESFEKMKDVFADAGVRFAEEEPVYADDCVRCHKRIPEGVSWREGAGLALIYYNEGICQWITHQPYV